MPSGALRTGAVCRAAQRIFAAAGRYQPYPGPTDVQPGAYGQPPVPTGRHRPIRAAARRGDRQPQPYPYPYRHHGPYAPPLVFVPAPPLASSTWSVAIDALFLERSSGGGIPLGYSVYNAASGLPPQVQTDNLYSDDALFPLEAGVRLEITRQITDYFSVSATYWGLQQWSVGNTIYGDPDNDTVLAFSPYLQLPSLLLGLDNTLSYTYASQVENVEVNASFRLNHDNSYWHLDWLWGARFINLSDQFTLTGIDSLNSAEEDLKYTTSNNLVGVQTGLQFVHGWGRFQWETGVKAGLMVNMYKQHGTDTASDPGGMPAGFVPGDASANGTAMAGLFEVSVAARMRITDELWLRLGYQFYDITGVALARGSSTVSATAGTWPSTGYRSVCCTGGRGEQSGITKPRITLISADMMMLVQASSYHCFHSRRFAKPAALLLRLHRRQNA